MCLCEKKDTFQTKQELEKGFEVLHILILIT